MGLLEEGQDCCGARDDAEPSFEVELGPAEKERGIHQASSEKSKKVKYGGN